MMLVQTFQFHDQLFRYTDHTEYIPQKITEAMIALIHDWQFSYPIEDTYVQREYRVPSIIVRLDCVVDEHGVLRVYEIQEGCGWVGYAGIANPEFRKVRDTLARDAWPPFKLVITDADYHMDDEIWLERVSLQDALATTDLLLVRDPNRVLRTQEHASILSRSLKPVRFFNNKLYGLNLGMWVEVKWSETDSGALLPWREGFVLKPVRGHGSNDVMIWNPDTRAGRATRTQIEKALRRLESMYMQDFIPPMRININNTPYNTIFRPFFGFDPRRMTWVPMHGVWTGRPHPELRLHGASNAISGPLIMEGF